jgi:DNA polymerase-3 subunit gamma/tau
LIALARKYRPTRFADLIGQAHVGAGLTGAVATHRVAHAYVLTGPRGVGKTSAARILAMALNCERRGPSDGEPCGACDSCRRIWSGSANLDVVEIDAASNRGVDDARDLRERATYAPSAADRHKVYIIDEAHMLTREAWNALLKILEEPPPRVVFVFATTEPQKITNTAAPVMSRMQRFDFRRLSHEQIAERLRFVAEAEGLAIEHDAVQLMARTAHGGMRDALSILDQALAFGEGAVTAERVRQALGLIPDELYAELLDIVAERRSAAVFPFVARLVDGGADLVEFIGGVGETIRALLVRVLGGEPVAVTEALRAALDRHLGTYHTADLLRMLKLLAETETAIRRSPQARLHVEGLLLHWTLLDRSIELAEVLAAVRGEAPPDQRAGGPADRERGGASDQRSGGPTNRATVSAPDRRSADAAAGEDIEQPDRPVAGPPDRRSAGSPVRRDPEGSAFDAVAAQWPQIVIEVGRRRRVVRETLEAGRPVGVVDGELVVEVPDSEAHVEGLARARDAVTAAIAAVTGQTLGVRFRPSAQDPPPPTQAPPEPRRLDERTDRAERLRRYRAKDPALDAMADALDLELLD